MGQKGYWVKGKRLKGYGIDAKGVIFGFYLGTFLCAIFTALSWIYVHYSLYSIIFVAFFIINGLYFIVAASYMIWSSRVGKIRLCRELIGNLELTKDDKVLDVGCGKGLYAIEAARFVKNSVGLDVKENAAFRANSERERVSAKFIQGDMRQLPFGNGEFEVSIAATSMNHIRDKEERKRALQELARVTSKQILIVDFQYLEEYVPLLQAEGFETEVGEPRYLMFPLVRVLKAARV